MTDLLGVASFWKRTSLGNRRALGHRLDARRCRLRPSARRVSADHTRPPDRHFPASLPIPSLEMPRANWNKNSSTLRRNNRRLLLNYSNFAWQNKILTNSTWNPIDFLSRQLDSNPRGPNWNSSKLKPELRIGIIQMNISTILGLEKMLLVAGLLSVLIAALLLLMMGLVLALNLKN